MKKNCP